MEKRQVGDSITHEAGHGLSIPDQKHRCTNCNTLGCIGSVGRGTIIEIQCRRCKTKYVLKGI